MSIPKEVEPILERLYAGGLTSDAASELGRQLQAVLEGQTWAGQSEEPEPEIENPPDPITMRMPDSL